MSIRCTPFCSPCEKGYKHHELLLALLNTKETEFADVGDLVHLQNVVYKHKAKGWDINSEILEENHEFRFPLLHWGCVLGKLRAVRWMLDNGFSATVQTKDTMETCVHRTLMTLPELMQTKSGRASVATFEKLLPLFKSCLTMGDHRRDTPLHTAANFMAQNRCYTLYENLFIAMLKEIGKMPPSEQRKCINTQNNAGDTIINLLASGSKNLSVIEKVLDAGGDSMIVNKLNIGPLDNAKKHGLIHIENFLKSSILRDCGVLSTAAQYRESLAEEFTKRRSERRSTYHSTLSSMNTTCVRTGCPNKVSETKSKSNETDIENVELLSTEDEEPSFHSSRMCSLTSNSGLPEDVKMPDVKKDCDDDDDMKVCTCGEDDNENTVLSANASVTKDQDITDSKFMEVMKQAGVLENLADVISNTKQGHVDRMKNVDKAMSEIDQQLIIKTEDEKDIVSQIGKKKREIQQLSSQLAKLRRQKAYARDKRKLLQEETQNLRKKLVCCESLLKTVPKGS